MVRFGPFILGVLGCLLVAGTPHSFAAPIVVESRSNNRVESTPSSTDQGTQPPAQRTQTQGSQSGTRQLPFRPPVEEGDAGSSGSRGESLYQLQLLQQEVQQLRGQVERLEHEISRMKATQEDRYLELDARIQSLMKQDPATSGRTMDLDVGQSAGESGARGSAAAEAGPGEQKMYEAALEMIRSREYDQAIVQLQQVIDEYPEGKYTPNAYYWLGEVYAAKPEPEYEKARQALAQVISFFPDHRKVPDAAFKLGKVYHLMGDCDRARDILQQIVDQQKGKSVARLAESYLREQVANCE